MALSFDEMVAITKWRTGQRTDMSAQTDESINLHEKYVNLALQELATRQKIFGTKFNFLFPSLDTETDAADVVDGAYKQAVASDCVYVQDVWDSDNDHILERISLPRLIEKKGRDDTSQEGTPKYWTRRGSYIWLSPTCNADTAIVQFYRKRPATLTSTSTSSGIEPEYDELIVELACYKGFHALRDEDGMKSTMAEFTRLAMGMAGLYNEEEKARSGRARITMTSRHGREYR